MGYDKRIGRAFLDAGLGYGGSCFPKDVKALAHMANVQGKHPQLLEAVMTINTDARRSIVAKVRNLIGNNGGHLNRLEGKVVSVLGLAFKANTDDIRESQPIDIIRMLQADGAKVQAYDPVAMKNAAQMLPNVKLCEDTYECVTGADAVILATEWNEFKNIDLDRLKRLMRTPVVVDGRNLYDAAAMTEKGFTYRGVGRGYA
jgi:UDPglucose 6-dehydrogenase